jgi:hypothetical protein
MATGASLFLCVRTSIGDPWGGTQNIPMSRHKHPLVAVVLGEKYLVGNLQRGGYEGHETERER